MANRAALWAVERKPAEWTRGDDAPHATLLLGADYLVPLFWLGLFEPVHLESYRDPDGESFLPWKNRVPHLIAKREQCLAALESRVSFLESFLATADQYLPRWRELIESLDGPYISVDFSEIYWMAPQSAHDIRNALESMSGEGSTTSLLRITSLIGLYDPAKRDFEPDGERFKKFEYIVGYRIDSAMEWFNS